jgi:F-box/WD-40 domain protein MET30
MTWPQVKKARLYGVASDSEEEEEHDDPTPAPAPTAQSAGASLTRDLRLTRPWKSVYCERLVVERNWRKGRCQTKTINGAHTDGILCLQYHNTLSSPDYPVLITGSYDRTVRIWNLDTGEQVRVLTGHTRAVRALQFNQMLLFTGSLDGTVRMWNWRKGEVMRVFEDHIDGVTSVNYNGYLLASGSSDNTVCVRNFRTGGRFFLRGHEEPVNQVLLWDGKTSPADLDPMAPPRFTAQRVRQNKSPGVEAAPGDDVDVGQMLFSASDDVVKLWDLTTQQVVRTFSGHRAPIYSIKVIMVDKPDDDDDEEDDRERHTSPTAALVSGSNGSSLNQNQSASHLAPPGFNASHHSTIPIDEITPRVYVHSDDESERRTKKRSSPKPKRDEKCAMLVTSSHDGTVKLWDVETGRERNTLFGHIEGVWTVDMDALRLASGSYDRTIKVWDRQSGNCVQTLVGHRGAVTALQLSDDMIVSGSDNGDIMTWSFAPQKTVAAASPTPTPTQ